MATTTANKAGLRAAATAKTHKAAQRTPLPPRKGDVELAREAVAETKKSRKPAVADTAGKAAKTAERTALAAKALTVRPAKESEPNDKAAKYAALLAGQGWAPEVSRNNGMVELTATRGPEALFLSWFNEAHISGASTYTYADRTVKVRNPAEAMRIAGRTPDESKASQAKVASNRQFRRRATGPTIKHVPFDPETATDDELSAALVGHRVSWHNQYRVESESAIVGRRIRVDTHPAGHRIISFVDPESGFRAFRLDHLENVGRAINLERIKQEILSSLTRAAKKAA